MISRIVTHWGQPWTRAATLWVAGILFTHPSAHAEDAGVRKPLPTPEEIAQLPPDGGEEFNRLVFEKSPYLLQHARNPVDWYPWGDAAFERARREDKMVFLSIGYSTCHWCHVMEHESFEDEEVAKLMNAAFVCVKVDREERPDIDQVYMTVTQAMTGSGGWPMTVVMTPDKKPFFAGTYYPKNGRFGQPGMMDLIPKLQAVWKDQRAEAIAAADQISNQLASVVNGSPGAPLTEQILQKAFAQYSETFDRERGGFRGARKFPTPHNLSFLLRYWKRTKNPEALEIVEKTLKAMRLGGVWDHIGFGTHRYSTDSDWLLPHFEKMLYDQALLTIANVEAYQVTKDPFYATTAQEILAYVLRDMTAEEGGFFSAEDADSEGEEGLFYLWTVDEVQEVLGAELGALFIDVYNLKPEGNYFDEATRKKTGKNIPHLKKPLKEIADERDQPIETLQEQLESARKQLFESREKRIHPLKDDKILTDWNGLMIAAMARAGQGLGDKKYTQAARDAADLVLSKLRTPDGRLLKRRRLGESGLPAHLDDYAFMVWGLIDLYQATFEFNYLQAALELNQTMLDQFWDDEKGGLFLTADDAEKLIVRSKEIYDGATPSGNSVAAYNCARLAKITANDALAEKTEKILAAFSGSIRQTPSAYAMSLIALDFATSPGSEIVLAGDQEDATLQQMAQEIRRRFEPHNILIHRPLGENAAIARVAPYAQAQTAIENQPTAYVCRNYACELPTGDFDQFLALLDKISTAEPRETPATGTPFQKPIE